MIKPQLRPLAIELFAGSFGWGTGLAAAGWRSIGFDILHEPYHGPVPEHCELVLQDILTLHGRQFKGADLIVASPPCQAYSYRAMPWKRAKALPPPSNELFEACFRIQQEASEAAGRYIPMVVENVKGARPWVGRAAWHYGSFYLWGDVPALMPSTRAVLKCNPDGTNHGTGSWFAVADSKNRGASVKNGSNGSWFNVAHNTESGKGNNPDGRKGFARRFEDTPMARVSSKSSARKAASAAIAKIPFELSSYIGRFYYPEGIAA